MHAPDSPLLSQTLEVARESIGSWLRSVRPERQRLATVRSTRASQKMVAQSVFMLTIVQPRLPARSRACSAPLV